jgi:Oxysterol-binding protein
MHTLIRSGGYEVIKQIGKKILNGDFNLTTISFPIKVMLPLTILQTIAQSIFQFPIYLNLAGNLNDPLERFKYVIVATLSCFHSSSHFLKPLNPILGETYEMLYNDGSQVIHYLLILRFIWNKHAIIHQFHIII